jgi:predicted O-linked N-acetylglucosamine transferase (SPINDLY family)
MLTAALTASPGPVGAYQSLATLLIHARNDNAAERWARAGLDVYPTASHLWNLLGVVLRRTRRLGEALAALEKAHALDPAAESPLHNKANTLLDLGDATGAAEMFSKLAALSPANLDYQRMLAVAFRQVGRFAEARACLDTILSLAPASIEAWLDRASLASIVHDHDEALAVLERGLAANSGSVRLLDAKAVLLRRAGRRAQAEAFLREELVRNESAAWAHHQLAKTIDADREQANFHYRRSVALAPGNPVYRLALAESLDRTRHGVQADNIQEAYEAVLAAMATDGLPPDWLSVAARILTRVGDYDRAAALGSFAGLGRLWAREERPAPFLQHMARVKTPGDRDELIHQHRLWGARVEAAAAQNPVVRSNPRPANGKIRLGLLSSDLRNHVVGRFVWPLFEHLDPQRFEIYAYSFARETGDETQTAIAARCAAFRWNPAMSDRDAAQMIADDQLDMLIELGGPTFLNKLEAMAYRPAPIQASWLGYPHSSGLSAIDHLIVDPYLKPPRDELLIERPLVMPRSWIAMGGRAFQDEPAVALEPPETTKGFVTFGTANAPYKYGPEMLRTWARIVAAVPGSRFLFVRPECGAASFRENMLAHFAAEGVSPDRVQFEAVWASHLPWYGQMDICLDTFPQTGGTTTCESLWMGVPVVSLVGEALFERLSHSILNNAGLPDLSVTTVEAFVAKAVALAGDSELRRLLRANLRDQIRAGPLGQTEQFARDFYDLVERAVRDPAARRAVLQADVRAALAALATPQDEARELESAYQACRRAVEAGVLEPAHLGTALALFMRMGDDPDRLGSLEAVGRHLVEAGDHRSLIYQLPRVRTRADRLEVLAQHRAWGAKAQAAAPPIGVPGPLPAGGRKLRLGFVSSDLRLNAVAAFAAPLFEIADRERFELFCYSAFPGEADGAQAHIASLVDAFRWSPGASGPDLARTIAADRLDIVVEMGGSTNHNRLDALAHRLAPVQVSWLGYPQSTGLSTIDYLLADPLLVPPDPTMLLEQPLLMPTSWIALSTAFFREEPAPAVAIPSDRTGTVTFGSAGSTYKNTAGTVRAWAQVVAATPGSTFLFVRPEGGSPSFRAHMLAHFAAEGVAPDRVRFAVTRGGHLPYYGDIDIALDSFPQTGGTTTCEALWMGVPVVSLVGEGLYERLSHSILTNAGLVDLSVGSVEAYVAVATALAADLPRRRDLRANLRRRLKAGPLGDVEAFARDFYDLMATTAEEAAVRG